MSQPLVTNAELESQLTQLGDRLNLESTLHLFANSFSPDRGAVPGDFTEATYRGYEAVDLIDQWPAPVQRHDGVWSIKTPVFAWTPTTLGDGPTAQTVHGFYILAAGAVRFAGRFPGPVPILLGSTPLEFAVEIQLSDGIVFISLSLV